MNSTILEKLTELEESRTAGSTYGAKHADVYTFLLVSTVKFKIKKHTNAYNLRFPSTISLHKRKHTRLSQFRKINFLSHIKY